MPARHILVSGRVQGVFFRASAKDKADELNLTGWVRNKNDGTVEAYAEGADDALQQFINWCHQGPSEAEVNDVNVNEVHEEKLGSFEIWQ